jgi:hypothetical protein
MTSEFIQAVVKAVKAQMRNNDDEIESICNLKLGEIHERLGAIPVEERKPYAIVACKRAWLNHIQKEKTYQKHLDRYTPPHSHSELSIGCGEDENEIALVSR